MLYNFNKRGIMKIIDALNILGIKENEITKEIVKTSYRKACKAYHPDINPAGTTMMQAVNEAYETLLEANFPLKLREQEEFSNFGEELYSALCKVWSFPEITPTFHGAWLYLYGETKPFKHEIKTAGFRWASKKKIWYFRDEKQKSKRFRGTKSLEEIAEKYGSKRIYRPRRKALI